MAKKILITGASGFVGSFLVEEAISQGLEVYAGIRSTSSKKYLKDPRIKFFEVDFRNPNQMLQDLKAASFEYIIHNAGVTKPLKLSSYYDVNTNYTKEFVDNINSLPSAPEKFVYMSTAAAYGSADQTKSGVLTDNEDPKPITAYGKSKLLAEQHIKNKSEFPFLIFRPAGVFGPRDTDIYLVFKNISFRFAPVLGFTKQRLSMVYVKDLAKLIIKSTLSDIKNKSYFVSDGKYYDGAEFNQLIQKVLQKKAITVRLPKTLVKGIAHLAEFSSKLTKKPGALTVDKSKILLADSWECDISRIRADFDFDPMDIESALAETAQWYKEKGWL